MVNRPQREHWHSRLGIIFATSGSAIGLGTLWKLPYLVGQGGGGAFILLFLSFTLLLGTPLFIAELALGKYFQKSIVGIGTELGCKNSLWSLWGWLGIITTLLIAGWYGVVSGWGINYLVMALTDTFENKTPSDFKIIFEYFRSSGGLNLFWQALFVSITCLILARGVREGIERYSKIFFTLLFLLVLGLFVFALTLPGFPQALEYIIKPDFSKINRETILAALGLSLFALSLGQGIMTTYGSYVSKNQDIFRTAFIVSISVVFLSVIISLMIFPMVFSFGLPPESGEGLMFITMPYVTEQLPGSMAISALFFILLIFAALTSYMGQLEVLVASLMENLNLSRARAAVYSGLGCFIMGIPIALMKSSYNIYPRFEHIFHKSYLEVSDIIINWFLVIFSLGVCVISGYVLPKNKISLVLNKKTTDISFFIWYFLIRVLVPAGLIFVALSRLGCAGLN